MTWLRTCPNCGRTLYKENSTDDWICENCGWICQHERYKRMFASFLLSTLLFVFLTHKVVNAEDGVYTITYSNIIEKTKDDYRTISDTGIAVTERILIVEIKDGYYLDDADGYYLNDARQIENAFQLYFYMVDLDIGLKAYISTTPMIAAKYVPESYRQMVSDMIKEIEKDGGVEALCIKFEGKF